MKWLELYKTTFSAIQQQADDVAELYKLLYLQLKAEKQQTIQALLARQDIKIAAAAPPQASLPDELDASLLQNVDKLKVLQMLYDIILERIIQLQEYASKQGNKIFYFLTSHI